MNDGLCRYHESSMSGELFLSVLRARGEARIVEIQNEGGEWSC
jgi:hypothetical protein